MVADISNERLEGLLDALDQMAPDYLYLFLPGAYRSRNFIQFKNCETLVHALADQVPPETAESIQEALLYCSEFTNSLDEAYGNRWLDQRISKTFSLLNNLHLGLDRTFDFVTLTLPESAAHPSSFLRFCLPRDTLRQQILHAPLVTTPWLDPDALTDQFLQALSNRLLRHHLQVQFLVDMPNKKSMSLQTDLSLSFNWELKAQCSDPLRLNRAVLPLLLQESLERFLPTAVRCIPPEILAPSQSYRVSNEELQCAQALLLQTELEAVTPKVHPPKIKTPTL